MFDLLLLAQRLYRETDSAFDITSGPLTHAWGFFKRKGRLPETSELAAARARIRRPDWKCRKYRSLNGSPL